jgi:hypothetical protein
MAKNPKIILVIVIAAIVAGSGWWLRQRALKGLHPEIDGVERLSDTEFLVKQKYLDQMLANLAPTLQTARAVPNLENGKVTGFRLEEVQDNSPFRALGLEKGDLITGLDDVAFDEVGKGLNAFIGLRGSKECKLQIERNHQHITIHYKIDSSSL